MQNSDDKQLRLTAIMTMEWIGKQEGRIPQEMLDILKTEHDAWTRDHINHVIIRMQKHSQDPLASLFAVVRNTEIPDSIRANALREAGKNHSQDKRFKETVIDLIRADEAPLRAAAVSLLPDTSDQTIDLLAIIDFSLSDDSPGVRILALRKLAVMQVSDSEKLTRFEQALTDSDGSVIARASETIQSSGLSSKLIQQRLDHHLETGRLQPPAIDASPSLWQTLVELAKDTRHHGLRLYWVLAAAGIAIAGGFAVYYVFRLLIYIQQRLRRGFVVIGVLIVWTGLTCAMVALFVLGAFSFGHNSLVAPKDQFIIDAVAGSALLIYGILGWALGRLVRK